MLSMVVLGVFILQMVAFCTHSYWEDAHISFRYSRNWAEGKGLVYNEGEYVEGYSNLLWTVLHGIGWRLGLSMWGTNVLLVIFCSVLMYLLYWNIAILLFPSAVFLHLILLASLLFTTDIAGSFSNGLESACTAMAVALIIFGAAHNNLLVVSVGCGVLLCNRFDGIVYMPVVLSWAFYAYYRKAISKKFLYTLLAIVGLTFALLCLFRGFYYNELIPNSIRAKSQSLSIGHLQLSWRGTEYLIDYGLHLVLPFVPLVLLSSFSFHSRNTLLLLYGLVVSNSFLLWVAGGDWMEHYRLLTPFFPPIILLAGMGVAWAKPFGKKLYAPLCCLYAISVLFCFKPELALPMMTRLWQSSNPNLFFNRDIDAKPIQISNNIYNTDFQLKDDLVVIEWGGAQSQILWDVRVLEMWGLTDKDLAKNQGQFAQRVPATGVQNWEEIFKKRPSYLLFSWGIEGTVPFLWFDSILETPGLKDVLNDYMIVKKQPFTGANPALNQFCVRKDRELLTAFLLDYGSFVPAFDYPFTNDYASVLENGTVDRRHAVHNSETSSLSAWHQRPWTSVSGEAIYDHWIDYKSMGHKLASVLTYEHSSTSCFIKKVLDNTPLVLLFLDSPAGDLKIECYVSSDVEETPVASRLLHAVESQHAVQVGFVSIPAELLQDGADIGLRLTGESVGELTVCAFRWIEGFVPPFPNQLTIENSPYEGGMVGLFAALARQYNEQRLHEKAATFICKATAWPSITEEGAISLAEYLEERDLEKARHYSIRSALANPWEPAIYGKLLHIHERNSSLCSAYTDFSNLADANPKSFVPKVFLSVVMKMHGMVHESHHNFHTALDMLPKRFHKQTDMAQVVLGTARELAQTGAYEYARYLFRILIQRAPGPYHAFEDILHTYELANDWTGLACEWHALCDLVPDEAFARNHLKTIASNMAVKFTTLAREAQNANHYTEAEQLYLLAAEISPTDLWPRVRLGELYSLLGDSAAAEQEYRSILAIAPESHTTAAHMDALLITKADVDDRILFWRDLHGNYPEALVPALYYGMSLFDMKDYAASSQLFEELSLRFPNETAVWFNLGKAQLFADSKSTTERGLNFLIQAVAEDVTLSSAAAAVIAARAREVSEEGDYAWAEQLYRQAINVSPNDHWHKVHLGVLLEKMNRFQEAGVLYQEVLSTAPESPVTAGLLHTLFENDNAMESAAIFWDRLAKTYPEAPTPLLYLGMTHEKENKIAEARDAYRKLLERHPDHAEAFYRLGILEIMQGDQEMGISMVEEAAKRAPNLASDISGSLGQAAEHRVKQGDDAGAVHLYQIALQISPDDLWPQVYLGELYEKQGDLDAARDAYIRVLQAKPESPVTAQKLDDLLKAHETPEQSVAVWESITQSHPDASITVQYLEKARNRAAALKEHEHE